MQKIQTHTVVYAVGVHCAVCTQYAVGVSAKGSTHTVEYTVGEQCAVCTQYTVGVNAKRSTHTVDLANMGVGVGVSSYQTTCTVSERTPINGTCQSKIHVSLYCDMVAART